MYGASRAAGVGPQVTLCGRRFTLHARTIREYGVIEAQVISLRGNLFDVARSVGSATLAERVFGNCRRVSAPWSVVTYGEMQQWLRTWEGRAFNLWVSVRTEAYETIRDLVCRECERLSSFDECEWWWSDIQAALDQANCDDEIGALEWLDLEEAGENATEGIPWPMVYRSLGEEPFGFAPEQVDNMTIRQVHYFWCKRESLRTEKSFESQASALDAFKTEQDIQTKAAQNLSAGRRWDAL